jgi:hypothetical protein
VKYLSADTTAKDSCDRVPQRTEARILRYRAGRIAADGTADGLDEQ